MKPVRSEQRLVLSGLVGARGDRLRSERRRGAWRGGTAMGNSDDAGAQ
jgi:hypothetical protein